MASLTARILRIVSNEDQATIGDGLDMAVQSASGTRLGRIEVVADVL